jgi:hypothetical protein
MQDWKKYIEGFADKKIEHNLNVNIVNDQLKIMKEQNNPIIYLLENYPGLLQEEPGEIYFSQLSHCIQKDTDKSDVKILNDKFLYLGYMNNI